MANYEIGTLLLKLGYENQEQFDAGLARIETKIDAADAAGKRFYDSSREGYRELKVLAERGSEGLDELTESFVQGRINAGEYADAVGQLARVQALVERNGGRLRTTLEGVVVAERQSAEAISGLEREMDGLARKTAVVERELGGSSKTSEQLRTRLRLLRSELSQLSRQAGTALPAGALDSLGSRIGSAERSVRFKADPRDFGDVDEVEDYFKRVNAQFSQDGNVQTYRTALEQAGLAAKRLGEGVYEGSEAFTRLENVIGKTVKELDKLDVKQLTDSVGSFEERLKTLNGQFYNNEISAADFRRELGPLAKDANNAAASLTGAERAKERARLKDVSGQATTRVKKLDSKIDEAAIVRL